jgi:uncharacterized protein involved in exopolysaccharide biosynthesis
MEQIAIWDALRPRLWMIVAVCIVAGAAGYAFSFFMTEQYAATALVLVRPQQTIKMDTRKGEKEFLDFPIGSSAVETPSKTYMEIIKSPALIGNVVRQLGLDKNHRESTGFSRLVQDLLSIAKYGSVISEDPFTKIVKQVQNNISLKSHEDTYLFDVQYTGTDPQQTAAIATATAKLFIEFMEEIRQSETMGLRNHMQTQLEQARKQVETARQHVENYKRQHSVFLPESEYTSKLREIADLELELVKMEEAVAGSQGSLSGMSSGAKRARLVRLLSDRKAELGPLPGIERELKQLDEEVKVALAAYEVVEKEFKEADLRSSYATPEVRLVSQPEAPRLPSSPIRIKIAGIALLGGLVVGIGLAFLLEYLNRRIRSIQDIEEFIGVKVLATIPRITQGRWRRAGP